MSIPMISLSSHVYGGRRLKAGEKFYASGKSDAVLMAALKRARYDLSVASLPGLLVPAAPLPAVVCAPEPVASINELSSHGLMQTFVAKSLPLRVAAEQPIEQPDVVVEPVDATPVVDDMPAAVEDVAAAADTTVSDDTSTPAYVEPFRSKRSYKRRDLQSE